MLISLFAVGLKLGRVPLPDRHWFLPLRLASISMTLPFVMLGLGLLGRGRGVGHGRRPAHHASATMTDALQGFNEQLEKLVELAIVLLVGAMLPYTSPWADVWWFIALLFVVLRAVAVWAGMAGDAMPWRQRTLIRWFGIRGICSVFYLMFAIRHGVTGPLAQQLITLTLATVAVSIVVHGVSVQPLMKRYGRSKPRAP